MPNASLRTGARSSAARSRSRSRARIVTGPRRADPSVVYAKRTSRSPSRRLEKLDDDREALSRRRVGESTPPRGASPRPRESPRSTAWEVVCPSCPPCRERTRRRVTGGTRLRAEIVTTYSRRVHDVVDRRRWNCGLRPRLAADRGSEPLRPAPRGRPALAQARGEDPRRVLAPLPNEGRLGRLDGAATGARRPRGRLSRAAACSGAPPR